MKEFDTKIGKRLRDFRLSKNLTMRQVSETLNIHYTYVSKMEKGRVPSLKILKEVTTLYEITLPELFEEDLEIEWIEFAKEMKSKGLSPDQVRIAIETYWKISKVALDK